MRYDGQVALVTGAAGGIGGAIALRLAAEGARIAVIDRDEVTLQSRFGGLGDAFVMAGDCTDAEVLRRFVAEAEARLGPPDVLVNNVGQSAREKQSAFIESEEETWRFVLEVSLFTTLRLSRLVVPGMVARGYGRILNMSSNAAFSGEAGLADYASAKMGLVGFTRTLAREVAPDGVTVNAICPGAIRTAAHDRLPAAVIDRLKAATPAGFVGEPEDVAGLAAYLGSREARFITGQSVLIDGGRWMD